MKKLALHREVLRQLTPRDTAHVAGGLPVLRTGTGITLKCTAISAECTQICPTL